MEPKHERCVECGCPVDLQEPDPDPTEFQELLSQPIGMIAEVSLKRAELPSSGTLTAFENGLVFLPDLRQLPSGGLTAVDAAEGTASEACRPGFWTLLMRRTTDAVAEGPEVPRPALTLESASERFLDSPGGLFIRREAIVHVLQRGNLLRVERKPGRTVVFRTHSRIAAVKATLLKWSSSTPGRSLRMTFSG